jgi:hypothetical protein
LTTGELAETLGVQAWRVARLFELGILPDPPRVAGRRMIPKSMVPQVVDALRARGWLPVRTEATPP